MFTCANDGAPIFNSKGYLIVGSKTVWLLMAKWGLEVHVGYGHKKSKTELMIFLSTRILKEIDNCH